MTAAAFKATYSDWKVIKGRKVVQVVFELPLEAADEAYQVLGGMPIAAREAWCAIAKLNPERTEGKVMPTDKIIKSTPETPPPSNVRTASSAGAKSPAQIAGYLCTLPSFQKFLWEKFPEEWRANYLIGKGHVIRTTEEVAAECVRDICTVSSRSEITKDNAEWSALYLTYRLWEREAEVVPA